VLWNTWLDIHFAGILKGPFCVKNGKAKQAIMYNKLRRQRSLYYTGKKVAH